MYLDVIRKGWGIVLQKFPSLCVTAGIHRRKATAGSCSDLAEVVCKCTTLVLKGTPAIKTCA